MKRSWYLFACLSFLFVLDVQAQESDQTVTTIAWSPDGKTIATGSVEKLVCLWDTAGKKLRTIDAHKKYLSKVAFALDGKVLISASSYISNASEIFAWSVPDGKKLRAFPLGDNCSLTDMKISRDGKSIACLVRYWGQLDPRTPEKVLTFDIETGKQGISISLEIGDYAHCLVFTLNDQQVIVSAEKGMLFYGLQDGKMTRETRRPSPIAMDMSADQKCLATILGGTLRLYKDGAGVKEVKFPYREMDGTELQYTVGGESRSKKLEPWLMKVRFAPDGKSLAVKERELLIFLGEDGKKIGQVFLGYEKYINDFAFSPDGKKVALAIGKSFLLHEVPK